MFDPQPNVCVPPIEKMSQVLRLLLRITISADETKLPSENSNGLSWSRPMLITLPQTKNGAPSFGRLGSIYRGLLAASMLV